MTKLIVTPIDMSAPGSYRERKRLLHAYAKMQKAQESTDIDGLLAAFETFEALVVVHAETDDGSTVAEALEMASADEFDALLTALLGDAETVPNQTARP